MCPNFVSLGGREPRGVQLCSSPLVLGYTYMRCFPRNLSSIKQVTITEQSCFENVSQIVHPPPVLVVGGVPISHIHHLSLTFTCREQNLNFVCQPSCATGMCRNFGNHIYVGLNLYSLLDMLGTALTASMQPR